MKVIIAGGRDFTNLKIGFLELNQILPLANRPKGLTILSGQARGADRVGEIFAKQAGIPVLMYPALWDRYGRSAGYRRNEVMANNADVLIAFWDGVSKGTKHMIDLAREKNLKVIIVNY